MVRKILIFIALLLSVASNACVGDTLIASNRSGDTTAFSKVCTTAGTFGTLSGVTATTISGSNILTINAGSVYLGQYITIAGVSGAKHLVARTSATQWQIDSNANASVSAAAVAYQTPSFTDFQ